VANAADFALLHRRGDPLFLPNAWDYASAAILAGAGYRAIGTTSLGVAASVGKRDASGETRHETLALVRLLTGLPVMLTVDIESGFSDNPSEVAEYADMIERAGAVGVNLEDGRGDGTLAPLELHRAKVQAVKSRCRELFVNARTDTYWLGSAGHSPLDETLLRCNEYVEAGADGVFVPGALDIGAVAAISSQVDAPLNVLYLPGTHTFNELAGAGAARVSTGSLLFRSTLRAVLETASRAQNQGLPSDPGPSYREVQASLGSRL
jgi:2-methylisocitrate lyase-like PEP mutase family enzyme